MPVEIAHSSMKHCDLVEVRGTMKRDDNAMEAFTPVREALAQGVIRFVIDLTGTDINGHLAGEISLLNVQLRRRGGDIHFVGLTEKTQEIFQLMGLMTIFKKKIYPNPVTAISAFK